MQSHIFSKACTFSSLVAIFALSVSYYEYANQP